MCERERVAQRLHNIVFLRQLRDRLHIHVRLQPPDYRVEGVVRLRHMSCLLTKRSHRLELCHLARHKDRRAGSKAKLLRWHRLHRTHHLALNQTQLRIERLRRRNLGPHRAATSRLRLTRNHAHAQQRRNSYLSPNHPSTSTEMSCRNRPSIPPTIGLRTLSRDSSLHATHSPHSLTIFFLDHSIVAGLMFRLTNQS